MWKRLFITRGALYSPPDPERNLAPAVASHRNHFLTLIVGALEKNARCPQTQEHGDAQSPARLNLLHLNLDSASLLRKLFAGDKKKTMCVCVCVSVFGCVPFGKRAHVCVLLSPSVL